MRTPRTEEELHNYAASSARSARTSGSPPFDRDAVAAIVEHGVRLAGRQEKITTRFNEIADVIREAGYWAAAGQGEAGRGRTTSTGRIEQRARRLDLVEEMLRERIAEGTLLVDLEGAKVGQVNGLVVLDLGDYSSASRRGSPRSPRWGAPGSSTSSARRDVRGDPQQGRAHPRRLPARPVRPGQAAGPVREPLLRAELRRVDGDWASSPSSTRCCRAWRGCRSARRSRSPAR